MNTIRVLLFAGARDSVGASSVELEVNFPTNTRDLKTALGVRYPSLEAHLNYGRSAYGNEFIDDDFVIESPNPVCEFALIPPVSGG